jgi:hypothetical protein
MENQLETEYRKSLNSIKIFLESDHSADLKEEADYMIVGYFRKACHLVNETLRMNRQKEFDDENIVLAHVSRSIIEYVSSAVWLSNNKDLWLNVIAKDIDSKRNIAKELGCDSRVNKLISLNYFKPSQIYRNNYFPNKLEENDITSLKSKILTPFKQIKYLDTWLTKRHPEPGQYRGAIIFAYALISTLETHPTYKAIEQHLQSPHNGFPLVAGYGRTISPTEESPTKSFYNSTILITFCIYELGVARPQQERV